MRVIPHASRFRASDLGRAFMGSGVKKGVYFEEDLRYDPIFVRDLKRGDAPLWNHLKRAQRVIPNAFVDLPDASSAVVGEIMDRAQEDLSVLRSFLCRGNSTFPPSEPCGVTDYTSTSPGTYFPGTQYTTGSLTNRGSETKKDRLGASLCSKGFGPYSAEDYASDELVMFNGVRLFCKFRVKDPVYWTPSLRRRGSEKQERVYPWGE